MRKPRALQLSIPSPCSERWSGMTPAAGGRHCAACNKVVTDFSGMTDRELFQFFKDGKTGCGRFYEGQLERIIAAPREPKHSFWIRTAIAFTAFVSLARDGWAQARSKAEITTSEIKLDSAIETRHISHSGIQGRILDQRGLVFSQGETAG